MDSALHTIELEKAYNPKDFEERVYADWERKGCFKPVKKNAGAKRYVVVIPPPNVTGVLHMGHGLNNVLQDIIVRYHRMKGDETLWIPGTDHALQRKILSNGSSKKKEKRGMTLDGKHS